MNTFSIHNVILIFAVLLTGLLAGLFYGYVCSVNLGLGRLSDLEYIKAMQSINVAILNPAFFLSFFGPLILLPIATWSAYQINPSIRFYLLLSASIIYLFGVMGVTIGGNIPLNEALADFGTDGATAQDLLSFRDRFQSQWNQFHLVRTWASIIAFFLGLLSIYTDK